MKHWNQKEKPRLLRKIPTRSPKNNKAIGISFQVLLFVNQVSLTQNGYETQSNSIFHWTQKLAASKNLIVTADGSAKKVLFLVQFHPLDPTNTTFTKLIEDLYIMASHRSNLRNKHKISGQMLGIGFRDGYERGESAGDSASNGSDAPRKTL
ncbi:hypothetical protein PSTT_14209, partial [Puccinia striiformis]